MNDFKQWLLDTYTHNEVADIARHGCSGGVAGMIYLEETVALYRKFADAIHVSVRDFKDATGKLPQFVVHDIDHFECFSNNIVWFAAKWFAHEITQGEYIELSEVNYV